MLLNRSLKDKVLQFKISISIGVLIAVTELVLPFLSSKLGFSFGGLGPFSSLISVFLVFLTDFYFVQRSVLRHQLKDRIYYLISNNVNVGNVGRMIIESDSKSDLELIQKFFDLVIHQYPIEHRSQEPGRVVIPYTAANDAYPILIDNEINDLMRLGLVHSGMPMSFEIIRCNGNLQLTQVGTNHYLMFHGSTIAVGIPVRPNVSVLQGTALAVEGLKLFLSKNHSRFLTTYSKRGLFTKHRIIRQSNGFSYTDDIGDVIPHLESGT